MSQQGTASGGMTDRMSEAGDQAKEKVSEAAESAKHAARGGLRGQIGRRSGQAGQQLTATAADVRAVGDQLRERGNDGAARLADQAADRSERLASYLSDSDPDRILADVEDFARRQPWAVALGGLAVGFAASRMLKASSTRRSSARSQTAPPSGYDLPPIPEPVTEVPPATPAPVLEVNEDEPLR